MTLIYYDKTALKSLKKWNGMSPDGKDRSTECTSLPNGRMRVRIRCSANAFEPKDLNVTRNPLLAAKAVDRQPAVSRSEMRC